MRKTARNGLTPFESHYCTSGYKFRDAVKQMKSLKDVGAQFLLCSISRDHPKCVEKLTEAGADVNGVGMYPECSNPFDTYDLDPVKMMNSTPLSLSVKFHRVECLALLLKAGVEMECEGKFHAGSEISKILFAAGVIANTADTHSEVQNSNPQLSLKHLCREFLRKHLIVSNSGLNLFVSVPQLKLPSLVEKYLLYNVSLEDILKGR